MSHKHAELMKQYAQDATETDRPWERWEIKTFSGTWNTLDHSPMWKVSREYRRKPRERTTTLPLPLESLDGLEGVFYPGLRDGWIRTAHTSTSSPTAKRLLAAGLAFRTKEEVSSFFDGILVGQPRDADVAPARKSDPALRKLISNAHYARQQFMRSNGKEPDLLIVGRGQAIDAGVDNGNRIIGMRVVISNYSGVTVARGGRD